MSKKVEKTGNKKLHPFMVEGGFVDCDRMGNLEWQQYSSLSHWLNRVTPKLCEKVVDAGPKGPCEEGGWLVGKLHKFLF